MVTVDHRPPFQNLALNLDILRKKICINPACTSVRFVQILIASLELNPIPRSINLPRDENYAKNSSSDKLWCITIRKYQAN